MGLTLWLHMNILFLDPSRFENISKNKTFTRVPTVREMSGNLFFQGQGKSKEFIIGFDGITTYLITL